MEITPTALGDSILHHVSDLGKCIIYVNTIIDCYVITKQCWGLLSGFAASNMKFSYVFT